MNLYAPILQEHIKKLILSFQICLTHMNSSDTAKKERREGKKGMPYVKGRVWSDN